MWSTGNIWKEKDIGPKMELWGVPQVMSEGFKLTVDTEMFLFHRQEINHLVAEHFNQPISQSLESAVNHCEVRGRA